MKAKKQVKKGDVIKFISGNFKGLHATILEVNFSSKDERAIYGYLHTIELSNGKIGYIEKSEHWRFA